MPLLSPQEQEVKEVGKGRGSCDNEREKGGFKKKEVVCERFWKLTPRNLSRRGKEVEHWGGQQGETDRGETLQVGEKKKGH